MLFPVRSAFFSVVALSAAVGCSSTVSSSSDAGAVTDVPSVDAPPVLDVPPVDRPATDTPRPGRVPLRHRATATMCPADRPSQSCQGPIGGPAGCTSDRECTMGTNGRCIGNSHDGCRCNYDVCRSDSECAMGGVCECRLASRFAAGANVCLAGNCRVDADCGSNGYCSPTLGDCGEYGGLVGYYCHTAADECIDDADCANVDAGFLGQGGYCAYSREVGHWRCSNQGCAG